LARSPHVKQIYSATANAGIVKQTTPAGGRVLGVTARAATLEKATTRAYEAVGKIRFNGMQFRHNIGAAR